MTLAHMTAPTSGARYAPSRVQSVIARKMRRPTKMEILSSPTCAIVPCNGHADARQRGTLGRIEAAAANFLNDLAFGLPACTQSARPAASTKCELAKSNRRNSTTPHRPKVGLLRQKGLAHCTSGNESGREDAYFSPASQSPHMARDQRPFDLIGIALGIAHERDPIASRSRAACDSPSPVVSTCLRACA